MIAEVKNSIISYLILLLRRIQLHGNNNLLQRGRRHTKNLLHVHRKYLSIGDALWMTWTNKQDLESSESVSLQNYTDNDTHKNNKKKMRAPVLQGGGALGAFQAGAFKALYEKITREDKETGSEERPIFDIIAGTSIGAINAAVC